MMKMNSIQKSLILSVLLLTPTISLRAEESSAEYQTLWGKYTFEKYGKLNEEARGKLTSVFRALDTMSHVRQTFMGDYKHPEEYEWFKKFLVQAFSDAMHGDVVEGIFENVLLEFTPPRIVLEAVAPHIGEGGKLEGILEGKHSDIAKHIQRQPQQGHIGPPNFIEYVRFLQNNKRRKNHDVIVDHMFRMDPQPAFVAMLWADYGFNPYVRRNPYLHSKKEEKANVRNLQFIQHRISDYLYRKGHSFAVSAEESKQFNNNLEELSHHSKWWVRLYIGCLMERNSFIKRDDILKELSKDENPYISASVERIRKLQE